MILSLPTFPILYLSVCLFVGCSFKQTDVHPGDKNNVGSGAPTKAHLQDGELVVFESGFVVQNRTMLGEGLRYDFTRTRSWRVTSLPLDSVAFLEYYTSKVDGAAAVAAIPPLLASTIVLFKALFGSCPTIYSVNGNNRTLEAENFSHSISPMFETDDLDRLDSGTLSNERFQILLTNEALETHYINLLSVFAVDHSPAYEALRNSQREIVLFGRQAPGYTVRTSSGKDITPTLISRDELWYRSDSASLSALKRNVQKEHLFADIIVPPGAEKMVIALRLRNSLFATVLLYDVMLAQQGLNALDWINSTTSNWIYAWRLHSWFEDNFGLDMTLVSNDLVTQKKHIGASGPIAWNQIAETFDVEGRDLVTVDISFLPDNWMIDWIGISFETSSDYEMEPLPLLALRDEKGSEKPEIITLLTEDDDNYLVTYPGQHYQLTYGAILTHSRGKRSFFVKSKGYYVEWLRPQWFDNGSVAKEFQLGEESVRMAADLWIAKKNAFERLFLESKIPLHKPDAP